MEKLIAGMGAACFKASSPAELDPFLEELHSMQKNKALPDQAKNAATLENSIRFVEKWQSYVDFWSQGKKTSAYKVLDELLEDSSWLPLVERSPVLEKSSTRYEQYHMDISAKRLEDLDEAICKLMELQRLADEPEANRDLLEPLEKIRKLRQEALPAKNWTTIATACEINHADPPVVSAFKQLLLAPAIIGYLKLDPEFNAEPLPGDTPVKILGPALGLAAKKGDLRSFWRLATFSQTLESQKTLWMDQEILGLDACLQGMEKEKNNQISQAIAFYSTALTYPGTLVSANFAIDRLLELKKKYPDDFNSSSPVYPQSRPAAQSKASQGERLWEKY